MPVTFLNKTDNAKSPDKKNNLTDGHYFQNHQQGRPGVG